MKCFYCSAEIAEQKNAIDLYFCSEKCSRVWVIRKVRNLSLEDICEIQTQIESTYQSYIKRKGISKFRTAKAGATE